MKSEIVASVMVLIGCGASAPPVETAASSSSRTYPIHLVRHPPVGARWTETDHLLATEQQTATEPGSPPQMHGSSTEIQLVVDCEVLAIDADQQVSRMRVAIQRFTIDAGQGPQTPVCPPVVIIERGRPGSITDEQGQPIEAGTAQALGLLLPTSPPPVDMNEHFGTPEPQAVGGSWTIDAQSAAASLAGLGMTVDPSNVQGVTTLVSAANDAILLRTVTRATHVGVPSLPAGSITRRADIESIQEDELPTRDTLLPIRDTVRASVDIEVDMPTPSGTQAHVVMAMRQELSHERTMAATP